MILTGIQRSTEVPTTSFSLPKVVAFDAFGARLRRHWLMPMTKGVVGVSVPLHDL